MHTLQDRIDQKAALEAEITKSLRATEEFKSCLMEAAARSSTFTSVSPRTVSLSVKVLEIETATVGLAFETHLLVRYKLFDRATGELMISRDIQSNGVVSLHQALTAGSPTKEARDRAVRANVEELILSLAVLVE
jgi:hypothetical protein